MDLRVRILADCDAGMTTPAVAAKYTVSASWVRRLRQRRRETGETAPRPQRHGPRPIRQTHADALRQSVKDHPDDTLAEHRERLGLDVSLSTLWRAFDALGLSLKKKLLTPPSKIGRT